MQAGGITEHLRRGTHAAQSCTGQLKAGFRYAHFPDSVPLNLWKMKKDSNKMYELKNCLPSKQPWTISAPNKTEAGAWLRACCWAEPASPHQRSQQSQLCSSLGWIWGTQKAPKSQPHTSYPQSYMSLFFSPAPVPFSPQYPPPLSLLILSSAELCSNSLTPCLPMTLSLLLPITSWPFRTSGHTAHLHANTTQVVPGMKRNWKQ